MGTFARAAAVAALSVWSSTTAAEAAEVVAGVGNDVHSPGTGAVETLAATLEVRSGPLTGVDVAEEMRLDARLAAAGEIDRDRDWWIGAGPMATLTLGLGLRLEASVMAGHYEQSDGGTRLGDVFEVRSLIGLSVAIGEDWRVGATYSHISNADRGVVNPGAERVFVTLAKVF